MKPGILFVQNRTQRAGAQTVLARLLPFYAGHGAALLCSRGGWLAGVSKSSDVRVIEEPFPRSRTLPALLWQNRAFAARAAVRIAALPFAPEIVQANDHTEGLLALAVARRLNVPSAIFLRSSGMTERDYFKYRCDRYDLVIAIGDELQRRAQAWETHKKIELIQDGIGADEFAPVSPRPASSPRKALVLGNAGEAKGWGDLADALRMLQERGVALPDLDFTSDGGAARAWFAGPSLDRVRLNFLGRVEAFRDLVRGYDLVINPSRMETFGMAAIEVLAAGVPLLSSRTGVIEQVQTNPEMLFSPNDSRSLAGALENVLRRWSEIDFGVEEAQRRIRERFLIDRTAAQLDAAYNRLLARA